MTQIANNGKTINNHILMYLNESLFFKFFEKKLHLCQKVIWHRYDLYPA